MFRAKPFLVIVCSAEAPFPFLLTFLDYPTRRNIDTRLIG
jgi:hypothetical protein